MFKEDNMMNETRKKTIENIIDEVLESEGYESYDEVDSLTSMTILDNVEDHFNINIDLNILEGLTEKTDLLERLIDEISSLDM